MACIAAAANFGAMAVRTPEALRRDGLLLDGRHGRLVGTS